MENKNNVVNLSEQLFIKISFDYGRWKKMLQHSLRQLPQPITQTGLPRRLPASPRVSPCIERCQQKQAGQGPSAATLEKSDASPNSNCKSYINGPAPATSRIQILLASCQAKMQPSPSSRTRTGPIRFHSIDADTTLCVPSVWGDLICATFGKAAVSYFVPRDA